MSSEKYDLRKLDLITLQKILRVLDHIKRRSELEGKETWFRIGDYTASGMNRVEFDDIVSNLESRKYIDTHTEYGLFIKLDNRFYSFYDEISKEITTRKLLLKTGSIKSLNRKPHYDPVNKILWVNRIEIKIIKQKQETIQEAILKFVFLDNAHKLAETFDYSATSFGEIDFNKKKDWTTFRNAFREINKKVSEGTNGTVDNFFLFGKSPTGNFQINPEYL